VRWQDLGRCIRHKVEEKGHLFQRYHESPEMLMPGLQYPVASKKYYLITQEDKSETTTDLVCVFEGHGVHKHFSYGLYKPLGACNAVVIRLYGDDDICHAFGRSGLQHRPSLINFSVSSFCT
jgi:hypothetical protein